MPDTTTTSGPGEQFVRDLGAAQDLIQDWIAKAFGEADRDEMLADLDLAAMRGRFQRCDELDIPEQVGSGWTRRDALKQAEEKLEACRQRERVAGIAMTLLNNGLPGFVRALQEQIIADAASPDAGQPE